jgi:iron complex outermembrane receptor protein
MNHSLPRAPSRLGLIVACGAAAVWSQAALAADAPASSDEPARLTDVVVTARAHYVATSTSSGTKTDLPLVETPQSVSVVTHDEIELLQMQNLEQATRYTAGIISGSYGGDDRFDWLTLRGFTPTEYLDGLRLPTAAVAEAQSRLDIYALEKIEVLKGPASALYGETPPGGLVNMTSKRPSANAFGEAQVQLGTYAQRQMAFDSTGPVDDGKTVLYRLTGLLHDSDAQVHYDHDRRALLAPSLTWNFMEGGSITLLSHYQDDHTGTAVQFLPSQGTLVANPNGPISTSTYTSEPNYDTYHRRAWDAGYEFDLALTKAWSIHQALRYTDLDMHYNTVYGGGFQEDLRTLNRYTYLVDSGARNLAVDTQGRLKTTTGAVDHDVLFGIDYFRASDNSAVGFGLAPSLDVYAPVYGQPVTDPGLAIHTLTHQNQTGIYVQEHAKIGRFAVTLGAREDHVTTDTFDALGGSTTSQDDKKFSGRAGVNYLFDSGVAPYVSFGKSFTPTIGTDATGHVFTPSTGVQYEAGIKYQPKGITGLFTVAAYQLTQQNALTPDPNPANIGFSVQTGEIRVRGFEAEGVTRLNSNLSINVTFTYTDPIVTKSNGPDLNQQVPLVPKTQASALADYTIRTGPLAGFGFGGGVRYTGASFGDSYNQWETPSYTLFDAILHYDTNAWHAAINANNLFDKRYVTTCGSADFCYLGSRQTVYLTLSRRW